MKYKSHFLDIANKRFSVRDYQSNPVEREKIELCLEAARLAPSACNSQPWKFVVIDEPATRDNLCDRIFSGIYSSNSFAKKAPVLLVVISEKGTFISKAGGFVRDTQFYLIDIGIAVEHFVLQAAEIGLGTCWIGWFNEKEAKKALSIPENKRIDVVIPLGYPAQNVRTKNRKSLTEISTFNHI